MYRLFFSTMQEAYGSGDLEINYGADKLWQCVFFFLVFFNLETSAYHVKLCTEQREEVSLVVLITSIFNVFSLVACHVCINYQRKLATFIKLLGTNLLIFYGVDLFEVPLSHCWFSLVIKDERLQS